jgi:flagellar transcriptional activator FlhD
VPHRFGREIRSAADFAVTASAAECAQPGRHADVYNEIKELNLAYLMLAQQLIRADRETAQYRLGIGADIAEVIDRLTPGQVLKMAGSNMVLCRFRFDDRMLLGLLSSHERDCGTAHTHAAILASAKPVEAVA